MKNPEIRVLVLGTLLIAACGGEPDLPTYEPPPQTLSCPEGQVPQGDRCVASIPVDETTPGCRAGESCVPLDDGSTGVCDGLTGPPADAAVCYGNDCAADQICVAYSTNATSGYCLATCEIEGGGNQPPPGELCADLFNDGGHYGSGGWCEFDWSGCSDGHTYRVYCSLDVVVGTQFTTCYCMVDGETTHEWYPSMFCSTFANWQEVEDAVNPECGWNL